MATGSIKGMIQSVAGNMIGGIVEGIVVGEEPLVIVLENDIKTRLYEANLVIPSEKRPLKIGDRLYMLSYNKNKLYYILDRK